MNQSGGLKVIGSKTSKADESSIRKQLSLKKSISVNLPLGQQDGCDIEMKEEGHLTSNLVIDVTNTPNTGIQTGKTGASSNAFKKCSSNKK